MFGLSAVAVDREIVGKDSDAELIGGEEVVLGFPPIDGGGACAGWGSALNLGDVEKSWDRRLVLTDGALLATPPFPEEDEKDKGLEEVSLEELLLNRRGIARGKRRTRELGRFGRVYRRRLR